MRSNRWRSHQGRNPRQLVRNTAIAAAACFAALLSAHTEPVLAWGIEGHHIIADIAEQYLEPATARPVRELLAIENENDARGDIVWKRCARWRRQKGMTPRYSGWTGRSAN